ncbi:sugar kinase [Clostridium perfringens]|nr:sugar kinase [Clostridium perfringens]
MKKVLVLGEMLMRLTPPNNNKIGQANSFNVCFGGAEVNVAVGLSNLGIETRVLTALPDNEIGNFAKSFLKSQYVDCDFIISKGDRLGLYYYEEGCSARKSKVVYDRKHSSITELQYEDIDVESLFKDVELLHISGITFGLSEEVSEVALKLVNEAKKRGIKISVDLNYRSKLFESYEDFVRIMKPVVQDAYLCFGWLNREDEPFKVLDASTTELSDEDFIERFRYTIEELKVKNIVTTLRSGTPYNYHTLQGIFYDGERIYKSSKYDFSMISRIGGGDAFAAGVIRTLIENKGEDLSHVIEFGTAAAVLKQTQLGDVSISSKEEVLDLINNKNLGSVNR